MAATISAAAAAPAAKPTQPPGDTQSRTPWDRRPGEPANWHHRFQIYRALGPGRTLEAAFREVAQAEHLAGSRPGAAWYDAARAWNWTDRAAAYDAEQRAALMAKEQERRFDAREKRLGMIDRLLHAAVDSCSFQVQMSHMRAGHTRRAH